MSPLIAKNRIWPVIIITVLAVDVAVGFALVRVANSDPHAAIEADYYQKAVTWDSTLAQERENAALRWTLSPSLGVIGADQRAPLAIVLRDSAGAPVRDATIAVEARQVAHAEEVVTSTLTARDDAGYASMLSLSRPGLWELRVIVTRGSERYTTQLRFDASHSDTARLVSARPGDAPGGS